MLKDRLSRGLWAFDVSMFALWARLTFVAAGRDMWKYLIDEVGCVFSYCYCLGALL